MKSDSTKTYLSTLAAECCGVATFVATFATTVANLDILIIQSNLI